MLTGAARRDSILLTTRTPSFGSADRAAGERIQMPSNFVNPLLHMQVYWSPEILRHVLRGPPHMPASFILQYWTLQSDPPSPFWQEHNPLLHCPPCLQNESLVQTLQNWPVALSLQENESGVLFRLEHSDQEVQASINMSKTGRLRNAESTFQVPLTTLAASLLQQNSRLQSLKSWIDTSAPWTLLSLAAR